MEKILLFKKRSFGEVTGTAFELLRQNFRLISISFLMLVVPLIIVSVLCFGAGTLAIAYSTASRDGSYWFLVILGYFCYVLALYAGTVVLHEVVIAYEHSDDPSCLKVSEIWQRIKEDRPIIIRSFFGLMLFWVVIGLSSGILIQTISQGSQSAGTVVRLITNLVSVYMQVCLSNFLMLRLRSEYTVGTSLSKSFWLTRGENRWWRTLGVHFTMIVVVLSLYAATLIPFMIVAAVCKAHIPGLWWYNLGYRNNILVAGAFLVYTGVIIAYLNNIALMGVTVNYYSLIEEKEHVGLMIGIGQIGGHDLSPGLAEGEY